ncbi:hypothetical protein GOP47_0026325 [Adiantum capillus-veneris]|nr:hypothetical protein GOP47_0026325 [Adiantum capillus-veneris]
MECSLVRGLPPCGSSLSTAESKAATRQAADCNWRGLLSMAFVSSKNSVEVSAALKTPSVAELAVPAKGLKVQDVVIVGGGIAGLATALALHRLGVKPMLLEQSDQLRIAGSSIGIWSNAWRALEALGVADSLRDKFLKLSGIEFFEENGSLILSLGFDEGSRDIELRGVERKALIETLREPLPDGTVFYDSQVTGIKKLAGGYTEVRCKSGQAIQTKVCIGCDGAGSVVAKWMNMGEPRYAGYTATRGLAVYPDGHNLSPTAKQILGRGVRAGIVPMDANSAYWFVVFNSSGERITDVELVREEALKLVRGWPSIIIDAVNRSPLETFSRRGLADRWMLPAGGPHFYKGGVTLAGDAMHPMTPNLGQGGCCALEDAVILGRALSKALSSTRVSDQPLKSQSQEMERIELALKSYTEERWPRMLPMAVRSYVTGALLQLDSEIVCSVRNKLLPRLVKVDRFLDHTYYDCGTLS